MQGLMQWLTSYASLVAIVVTIGVAILLVCCMECTKCGGKDKDDIFKHHEM